MSAFPKSIVLLASDGSADTPGHNEKITDEFTVIKV